MRPLLAGRIRPGQRAEDVIRSATLTAVERSLGVAALAVERIDEWRLVAVVDGGEVVERTAAWRLA